MTDSEDRLLARELGKLGARGAKLGAELGGNPLPDFAA